MIRLNEPEYDYEQTLDKCIAGINGNVSLRNKMTESREGLVETENNYIAAASTGNLYTIPPINTDLNPDPIVINILRKNELVKIYDQYFVPENKPARKIYDALKNAAKEKCPFCGGIGTPHNLDHFLPKAHFPIFSVLPHNLVPACRDCNMEGKGENFATSAEAQIIQPYLDHDRFFLEQWIFATYNPGNNVEIGEMEYNVSPPENWSEVDQQRVEKHFADFKLAKRYGTKAAEFMVTVLAQIKSMRQVELNNDDIQDVLLIPAINTAPFANHWQKGMYQALREALINNQLEEALQVL